MLIVFLELITFFFFICLGLWIVSLILWMLSLILWMLCCSGYKSLLIFPQRLVFVLADNQPSSVQTINSTSQWQTNSNHIFLKAWVCDVCGSQGVILRYGQRSKYEFSSLSRFVSAPLCVAQGLHWDSNTGPGVVVLHTLWLTKTSLPGFLGQRNVVSVGVSHTDAASLVLLYNWNPHSGKSCKINEGGNYKTENSFPCSCLCPLESTCFFLLRNF